MNVKVQQQLCIQEGYERVTYPTRFCHPERSEGPMQLAGGEARLANCIGPSLRSG